MTATTKLIKRKPKPRETKRLNIFELSDTDLGRPCGPDKWSARFLLHHLSDSETVFYERVCRVLPDPRQVLWVYDQSARAKGLDYARQRLHPGVTRVRIIAPEHYLFGRLHAP